MTIRYKTTDLSKAIEYMRIHLRDKYFVSAYKRGIEYIVQISGVEEVKDIADTPQTDNGIGCSRCEGKYDCYDRNLPHAVRCNNYGKITDEPQTERSE